MKKLLLFKLLLFISCFTTQAQSTMQYTYADGSNNRYYISQDSIEYRPIRPEESSSGTYSGGEPKKVALQSDDFEKVRTLFDQLLHDETLQNNPRTMGSGSIYRKVDDTRTKCILPMRSTQKTEVENLLKSLLE